jgi:uncharacterized protein (TIGR02145 family)
MMVDGKWTSGAHSSSNWSEPTSYATLTTSGNYQNHARADDGAVIGGRGICPPNWHVPADGEWGDILNAMESGSGTNHNTGTDDIGRGTDAGTRGKSKCMCSSGNYCATDENVSWGYSSVQGTDFYGFRVLPSGCRWSNGIDLFNRGYETIFWSSTAYNASNAWVRDFIRAGVIRNGSAGNRAFGLSVRCIRDEDPPQLDFYSPSTWSFGGYTWSDRVVSKPAGCEQVATLSTTRSSSQPAQYKIYNDYSGVERYYYNWSCALTVCPSGWSLPTRIQFDAVANATSHETLTATWGRGGQAYGAEMRNELSYLYLWSQTEIVPGSPYAVYFGAVGGDLISGFEVDKFLGFQVRCVK